LAFRRYSLRRTSAKFGVLLSCGVLSAAAMIEPAFLPVPIEQPRPEYPSDLRAGRIDGQAEVEVVVDVDGAVKAANLLQATEPEFGAAAVAALRRWRFLPGTKAGVPTEMSLRIPVSFRAADPDLPELPRDLQRNLPDSDPSYPLMDIARVDQPPTLSTSVPPLYPAAAGKDGPAAQVTVDFVVDEKGATRHLRIVAATDARFARAAAAAVSQWTFAPGRSNGRVVRTHLQVPVDFLSPHRGGLALPNAGTDLAEDDAAIPTLEMEEVDLRPHLRQATKAVYPEALRKEGKEGRVMVDLVVDENGAPRNIRVAKTTDPGFSAAAVKAVGQWVFSPGSKDGSTVRTHLQIPVSFNVTTRERGAPTP